MKKTMNVKEVSLAVCYYPEHWEKSLWKSDFERMRDCGIETIRIAEFAWNLIEAEEGVFNYDFYDEVLDLAYSYQLQVIFCTPTATPPAWLSHRYPEILNASIDGTLYQHGARRHYNYNSPVYQEFCKRIVEKSAAHYAKHPAIIGWQIDNEINCELDVFYSDSDDLAFRRFVKEKYESLKKLNKAWGTAFWNQTYTNWDEIHIPQPTVSQSVNPHRVLDYIRFISASARNFVKVQSDILRQYIKETDFITTNGLFGHLDNHEMTHESLDFITYDSYPNFAYSPEMFPQMSQGLGDRRWSRNLSETRAISDNFGIMEQQSGPNGWNTRLMAPAPRPGQMTLWTMQSIAHGADFISYFRWRTCPMGTEMYWHGILDYSSRENRRIKEVKEIHKKVQAMAGLAGAKYQAKVALLKDYDNVWDAEIDKWHEKIETCSHNSIFSAAQKTHTPIVIVYLHDNVSAEALDRYEVVIYPHPHIVDMKIVAFLERYVENGGILILGCRSGMKNTTGTCITEKMPGLLRPLTGADVLEFSLVAPDDDEPVINWDGMTMGVPVFYEILQSADKDTKVVGQYSNHFFSGSAALLEKAYGSGRVYYYGGAFSEESVIAFLSKLKQISPYKNLVRLPSECEIAVRVNNDKQFIFVLNYSKGEAEIKLENEMIDLFSGKNQNGTIVLKPYEAKVYYLELI